MANVKKAVSWSDVKAKLTDFDRAGLIGLVQDLYVASKDNQSFLHARFALGENVLKPYKATRRRPQICSLTPIAERIDQLL